MFSYAGPSAWNALPDYLKDNTLSLSTFYYTSTPNAFAGFLFYGSALYKSTTYLFTYIRSLKGFA